MKNQNKAFLFLLAGVLVLSYSSVDAFLIKTFIDYEEGIVEKIVDGDTVVVNSEKIRLLGINSPEKGEVGSDFATEFLIEEILGKNVRLYFGKEKYDKYQRKLAYIFVDGRNINLESVKRGYSNYYFPKGSDSFSNEIKNAWKECLNEGVNLCEKSKNNCVILENLDIKNQEIKIKNICDYSITLKDWSIKDEGRKKFVFTNEIFSPNSIIKLTKEDWGETYVWTSTGDSVFVRDNENKLVLFYSY